MIKEEKRSSYSYFLVKYEIHILIRAIRINVKHLPM
jgi:hypothetical protein